MSQLTSNGSKFSGFKELPTSGSESVSMIGMYHKDEGGMAVVIKLMGNRVLLTPLW